MATVLEPFTTPITRTLSFFASFDNVPSLPLSVMRVVPLTVNVEVKPSVLFTVTVEPLIAEITPSSEFVVVANPDVQWGPRSIDVLLEAAQRWPRAGALGPLIRDIPDGPRYRTKKPTAGTV